MLDYRMNTFLQLCETMNYRKTAERLNLTQPAITGHIHYLENAYGCQLFSYEGRVLRRTAEADALLTYARSASYDEQNIYKTIKQLSHHEKVAPLLRIGATKTIGEFIIPAAFARLFRDGKCRPSLLIDNTARLLEHLNRTELDIALIEGFFNRDDYSCQLLQKESFVGICSCNHSFAGKSLSISELLSQPLFIREPGSGTRAIFEQFLQQNNYTLDSFAFVCSVSSFSVTKQLVESGLGISFVYQSVADSSSNLATFHLDGPDIIRDMHYVYLKGGYASHYISLLEHAIHPPEGRHNHAHLFES